MISRGGVKVFVILMPCAGIVSKALDGIDGVCARLLHQGMIIVFGWICCMVACLRRYGPVG